MPHVPFNPRVVNTPVRKPVPMSIAPIGSELSEDNLPRVPRSSQELPDVAYAGETRTSKAPGLDKLSIKKFEVNPDDVYRQLFETTDITKVDIPR